MAAEKLSFDPISYKKDKNGDALYINYREQLSKKFRVSHENIYSYKLTTNDRLKSKWNKSSPQEFYAWVSLMRYHVELECRLLGGIKDDKDFAKLSSDIQDRVNYYYYDHVQLLLDYAAFANIDKTKLDESLVDDLMHYSLERDKYQKILDARYKELSQQSKVHTAGKVLAEPIAVRKEDEDGSSQNLLQKSKSDSNDTWFGSVIHEMKKLASFHSSYIIEWLGYFSMYRLMVVFVRLTWISFWTRASTIGWLDSFGNLFGIHINIELITAPTFVLNILSVFIFMLRLLADLAMMVKHYAFPNEAEEGVTAWDRLQMEWHDRYKRIGNDFAWVIFNSLTNYAIYFHIPIPIANWLLVAFLVYDVWFLAYRLNETEKLYQSKQKEWLLAQDLSNEDRVINHLKLRQLEYEGQETRGSFILYILAAILFVASFVLLLSISSPVMGPICFFICAFVVALYLSGADFGKAIRCGKERELNAQYGITMDGKNEEINQRITKDDSSYKITFHKEQNEVETIEISSGKIFELLNSHVNTTQFTADEISQINAWIVESGGTINRDNSLRIKAEKDAWVNFALGLAENIIVPVLIVGLFTINWPAALALTIVYIGLKHANLPKLYGDVVSALPSLSNKNPETEPSQTLSIYTHST